MHKGFKPALQRVERFYAEGEDKQGFMMKEVEVRTYYSIQQPIHLLERQTNLPKDGREDSTSTQRFGEVSSISHKKKVSFYKFLSFLDSSLIRSIINQMEIKHIMDLIEFDFDNFYQTIHFEYLIKFCVLQQQLF